MSCRQALAEKDGKRLTVAGLVLVLVLVRQ